MEYLIKASAITALFYICYKLFLQRETFFESNRWFLLIGIIASVGLPLLVIPVYIKASQHPIDISAFTENPSISTVTDIDNTFTILSSLYLLGVSFFLLKLLMECTSLFRLLKTKKTKTISGFQIIETKEIASPFSFFNFIVYNPEPFNTTELAHIINHEKVHAKHWHSIDTLFIQLATVVFWFNPFIWFYKKELLQNLEFIADKNAHHVSICKKSYEYVLLKTTINNHPLILTNNFYTSLIKKRIVMLHKSKSNKLNVLKYALVIPVLALFLMSFNTKEIYLNENNSTKITPFQEIEMVIISKDFSDSELEKVENEFKEKGVTLSFKSIKHNDKNEIIAIKIEASTKKTKTNFGSNSNNAIKPIKITYNSEDDSISIGTIEDEEIFITEDGTTKVVTSGTGSNVFILSEDEEDGNHDIEVIIEDENGNNKDTKVLVKRKTKVIHLEDDDALENKEKVLFITKDRDGKVLTEDVIQEKQSQTWVVEEGGANDIKIIKTKTKDNKLIISTDSEDGSPLIFIDDKESTSAELEALDPNNIATINIVKGDKHTKKYGEKAKHGVIQVNTKK